MNKFIFISLCAMVVSSRGESEPIVSLPTQQIDFIPLVSNLCAQGCPTVCQALRTICPPMGAADCEEKNALCSSVCASTCSCITACGPNCDQFETNCITKGLPQVAPVFCPINGGVCDVKCVIQCPQKAFSQLLQKIFADSTMGVQMFIRMLMSGGVTAPTTKDL